MMVHLGTKFLETLVWVAAYTSALHMPGAVEAMASGWRPSELAKDALEAYRKAFP